MPKKAPKMSEEERLQWEADKAAAEAEAEVPRYSTVPVFSLTVEKCHVGQVSNLHNTLGKEFPGENSTNSKFGIRGRN